MSGGQEGEGIIIEFTRIGVQVKVVACDTASGTEAAVIVPLNTSRSDMVTLAQRKLHYLLGKKDNPSA